MPQHLLCWFHDPTSQSLYPFVIPFRICVSRTGNFLHISEIMYTVSRATVFDKEAGSRDNRSRHSREPWPRLLRAGLRGQTCEPLQTNLYLKYWPCRWQGRGNGSCPLVVWVRGEEIPGILEGSIICKHESPGGSIRPPVRALGRRSRR